MGGRPERERSLPVADLRGQDAGDGADEAVAEVIEADGDRAGVGGAGPGVARVEVESVGDAEPVDEVARGGGGAALDPGGRRVDEVPGGDEADQVEGADAAAPPSAG